MTRHLNTPEDRGTAVDREFRTVTIDDLETRETADGLLRFEGVASVVDAPYTVRDMLGEYQETIAKGAFHRTIRQKRADVRLLKNHNSDFVFARTKSGTLELADDPHLRGVAPALDPSNPQVQTLRSELGRGDVDQMSIGFRVKDQEWSPDYTERTIREIELFEVSIVTFPANPATSAGLRSFDELLPLLTDIDADEADIRRAIEALQAKLPAPLIDEAIAARDRADLERLERKIAERPAPFV